MTQAKVTSNITRPVLRVRGARQAVGWVEYWTEEDLVAELTTPRPARSKIDAPGWLPVQMVEGETRRRSANVAAVWALVCDLDDDLEGWDVLVDRVRSTGKRAILHTTWSHTPERPRARVVFPLDEAVTADQWTEVWEAGARWASSWGAVVDGKCKDPSRLYFLPALERARWWEVRNEFRGVAVEGEVLTWRWLVAHHRPPPEPVLPPPPPRASAGRSTRALEAVEEGRRRFARVVLARRCEAVVAAGKGGRNQRLYTGARTAGQLVAAGVLEKSTAEEELVAAGRRAGLTLTEAARAVANGLTTGEADGAWTFTEDR